MRDSFPKVTYSFGVLLVMENLLGTNTILLRDFIPCMVVVVDTICKEPPIGLADVRVLPWRGN
jgi:hypothetical protein